MRTDDMYESALKQGQKLAAVWGPLNPEGQVGFSVANSENVESITVAQLAGPMGWYDVARIAFADGQPDAIFPLHMMEQIDTLPASQ
jgi:hypothetical protein